jgi:archaellum component FlaC
MEELVPVTAMFEEKIDSLISEIKDLICELDSISEERNSFKSDLQDKIEYYSQEEFKFISGTLSYIKELEAMKYEIEEEIEGWKEAILTEEMYDDAEEEYYRTRF